LQLEIYEEIVMKILLATDGSEFSFAAAKNCCKILSFQENTTVRIISVIEPIMPTDSFGITDEYYAIAQTAARGIANDFVEDIRKEMLEILGDTKIDIETKTIDGNPRVTIIEEAENWGADLIVVGSHGRGFWGRMFLGSVSDAVVKHAPCSVLVVRKDESEKEN
jgi:nucleotide-binding universal stress UspA family protein